MAQFEVLVAHTSRGLKLWAKSATSQRCYWGSLQPLSGMQFRDSNTLRSSKISKGYQSIGLYQEDVLLWLCGQVSRATTDEVEVFCINVVTIAGGSVRALKHELTNQLATLTVGPAPVVIEKSPVSALAQPEATVEDHDAFWAF